MEHIICVIKRNIGSEGLPMKKTIARPIWPIIVVLLLLAGCVPSSATPSPTAQISVAEEIVIYGWDGGVPQAILDDFTEEFGINIKYRTFTSYAEASESIQAGEVYDVVFLGTDYVGQLIEQGDLTELTLSNIANLRNVAINFRDLSFDPGNRYSVPYSWGTTGLVVRKDLFAKEVISWNDLWEAEVNQAGIWDDQRSMIGLTLRSLGYSANTDKPEELEAALKRLIELKERALFMEEFDPWTSAAELASGRISIALGWAYDAMAGRELNSEIDYVIPQEGTLLWLESLVIPVTSTNQAGGELFINYMLRPEVAAQFVNETFFAVTIEAASKAIDADILSDPVVYPTDEMLVNAEIVFPLSPESKELYDDVWRRFMDAPTGAPLED